ncbi:hypothetical protein OAD88_03530 [Flavobacteriaceae bacterium]|nr:hypothetical protein [Flavobacteriaceae bacterium]MDB9988430.1 hypothetical protein [Flavobacteriaceae bacterium]
MLNLRFNTDRFIVPLKALKLFSLVLWIRGRDFGRAVFNSNPRKIAGLLVFKAVKILALKLFIEM